MFQLSAFDLIKHFFYCVLKNSKTRLTPIKGWETTLTTGKNARRAQKIFISFWNQCVLHTYSVCVCLCDIHDFVLFFFYYEKLSLEFEKRFSVKHVHACISQLKRNEHFILCVHVRVWKFLDNQTLGIETYLSSGLEPLSRNGWNLYRVVSKHQMFFLLSRLICSRALILIELSLSFSFKKWHCTNNITFSYSHPWNSVPGCLKRSTIPLWRVHTHMSLARNTSPLIANCWEIIAAIF